jgi:hypothetical protein
MNPITLSKVTTLKSGAVELIDNRGEKFGVFEAFTAVAIVAQIAAFALEYLKGEKINALFGRLESNLSTLIEQAVREMKQFVRDELDSREVDELQSKVWDAIKNLRNWENTLDSNYFNKVYDNCDNAETRLKKHGAVALFCYLEAVSLLVLYHVVRFKVAKAAGDEKALGHLQNAKNIITPATEHAVRTANEIIQFWRGRISGVTGIETWAQEHRWGTRCTEITFTYTGYARFVDNGEALQTQAEDGQKGLAVAGAEAACAQIRDARIQTYQQKVLEGETTVMGTVSAAISRWNESLDTFEKVEAFFQCPIKVGELGFQL